MVNSLMPTLFPRPAKETALPSLDKNKIPVHIALIMDGNGRWAKGRHLPRLFGHRAGIASVRETVKTAGELGVKVLTLYAFSAENWARPTTEVQALMRLLQEYIVRELPELQKKHVKLRAIGRLEALTRGRAEEAGSGHRGHVAEQGTRPHAGFKLRRTPGNR